MTISDGFRFAIGRAFGEIAVAVGIMVALVGTVIVLCLLVNLAAGWRHK